MSKQCLKSMLEDEILIQIEDGYIRKEDYELLEKQEREALQMCYLMHRNDILIKSIEPKLKKQYCVLGYEALYYIMIQGEVHGAVIGKYKFGPDVIEKAFWNYKDEIIQKLGRMLGCTESEIQNVTELRKD